MTQCSKNGEFSKSSPWSSDVKILAVKALIKSLELAEPNNQGIYFCEAFELLSWRTKRTLSRKIEVNKLWFTFTQMLNVKAYVDAACLLIPDDHLKVSIDLPGDGASVYLMYPSATSDEMIKRDTFKCNSLPLAILAAALDAWADIASTARRASEDVLVAA